ncbi:hypothetical protein [uncultured Limosilactobacillus sp.]|uniref:hypothetical protein n=1 Tax=uncultured Limosilactobacillus sp. TaxID=2837629 RepID=UPI0025FC690F|nr:hypothetical protein [uncultured Limosilactobacillus sp.]
MSVVLDLTTILVLYAVSEFVARKTHAVVDTVLTISVLALFGFWAGIFPQNMFKVSGIDSFGMAIVGLMLVSLGTTINLAELKRQSKVVMIAILCAAGASCLIIIVAILLNRQNYGIVGAPIYAGGNAATLVLLNALKVNHLQTLTTYALAVLTFQNFIGIPIATYALKKESQRLLDGDFPVEVINDSAEQAVKKPLALTHTMNTPIMCLTKLGLVASLSYGISLLVHGVVNYLVICFVLGILFYQLGFLDQEILGKTGSSALITFLVTVVILDSLADTSPHQVLVVLGPLMLCLVVGTIGSVLTATLISRVSDISLPMAIALGMTCTFGFPTTMIMSQEIAASAGRTIQEQQALERYFMPKMLTAGLVTVTLISVFFAGFAINYLS